MLFLWNIKMSENCSNLLAINLLFIFEIQLRISIVYFPHSYNYCNHKHGVCAIPNNSNDSNIADGDFLRTRRSILVATVLNLSGTVSNLIFYL